MDRLTRRGPDGSGTWVSPSGHAALGHTRLAIVDPTPRGHQPMIGAHGQVAVSFNGEIYNAPELRSQLESRGHRFRSSCDTEVLVEGWIRWGRGLIERIRGMFSVVIWDDRTHELFAAVDHAGMKPLVYMQENGRVLIASDADAVRALNENREPLDPIALRHVLTLGCCPAPMTMWTGMHKLCSGHTLRWKPGSKLQTERYWSPPDESTGPGLDADQFAEMWERTVREHLRSDVPVGVFLSGGLDSACVTGAATRLGAHPACFTLAMDGPEDESADARRLADRLGLVCNTADHRWDLGVELDVYADAFDEPQSHSALLTQTRICGHASRSGKTLLGGDGGDEGFGGYLWQREQGEHAWQNLAQNRSLRSQSEPLSELIRSPDASDDARNIAGTVFGSHSFVHGYLSRVMAGFHPAESCALTHTLGGWYDEERAASWLTDQDRPELDHLRRVQRLDLLGFCANSILPKLDRASMHFGLEVRSPMLDRKLLEYGLGARVRPIEMEHSNETNRPDLRRYASAVLGETFTKRAKQGFSLRRRDEWEQWIAISKQVNRSKLVTGGYLRSDWMSFVPHRAVYKLRSICMLSAWGESRL